jgi:Raf kinase inhibitor-like YbhB/YbcL family protein
MMTDDALRLVSEAFDEGGTIPARFTCDGADVSPPLAWSPVPTGTTSLALVVEDPDAPSGFFTHWLVYDLPAHATGLPEHVPPEPTLDNGARQGTNDFRRVGYGGPCPPRDEHRYVFALYALDAILGLPPEATRTELLDALDGHVLARGTLTGRYRRR